jgi:hypothetical protein
MANQALHTPLPSQRSIFRQRGDLVAAIKLVHYLA